MGHTQGDPDPPEPVEAKQAADPLAQERGGRQAGDTLRARQRAAQQRLAKVSGRQFGVFTAAQARSAGIDGDALAELHDRGLVVRRARGIYAARAVPDSSESRWLVAQLRHGPSAALSHRTAAAVHGMSHGLTLDAVHLTVRGRSGSERPGCRLHRGVLAPGTEVVARGPFRVTSVARTLCDLAGELGDVERLRDLTAAAVRRGEVDAATLRAVLGLRKRFPGRAIVRRVVDELSPLEAMARGDLESRFLRLTTAAEIAPTALNHPVVDALGRRRLLDAVWLPEGVYAELDSRRHHGTLVDWHDDLRRENELAIAGFTCCLRFSWWDIHEHPAAVVDSLRRALGR
jgi:hypothetical protein